MARPNTTASANPGPSLEEWVGWHLGLDGVVCVQGVKFRRIFLQAVGAVRCLSGDSFPAYWTLLPPSVVPDLLDRIPPNFRWCGVPCVALPIPIKQPLLQGNSGVTPVMSLFLQNRPLPHETNQYYLFKACRYPSYKYRYKYKCKYLVLIFISISILILTLSSY